LTINTSSLFGYFAEEGFLFLEEVVDFVAMHSLLETVLIFVMYK